LQNSKFGIANWKGRSANYEFGIAKCQFGSANSKFGSANCEFGSANCKLGSVNSRREVQIGNSEVQITNSQVQIAIHDKTGETGEMEWFISKSSEIPLLSKEPEKGIRRKTAWCGEYGFRLSKFEIRQHMGGR
jgi:hypothetical protein